MHCSVEWLSEILKNHKFFHWYWPNVICWFFVTFTRFTHFCWKIKCRNCSAVYSLGVLVVLGVVGWTALVRSLGSIYCLQPTVCKLNWRKTNLHKRHFPRPTLNICTELSFQKFTVKRSQKRPQNKCDSAGPSREVQDCKKVGHHQGHSSWGQISTFLDRKRRKNC